MSQPCGLGNLVTSPALGTIKAATGVTPYPQPRFCPYLLPSDPSVSGCGERLASGPRCWPQTQLVQMHGHLPALAQPRPLWDVTRIHLTARLCSKPLRHGPS